MKNKTSFTARLIAVFASLLALHGPLFGQSITPIIPVGSLDAFPTIVQTGTKPNLTWAITLPERVTDVVTVTTPGTITPLRCLIMDVRVLGAPVKKVNVNPQGKVTGWSWLSVQAQLNYDDYGYGQIFYNKHDKVNSNSVIHSRVVAAGNPIKFGGRYSISNSSWSPFYSPTTNANNVVVLKDGDSPPAKLPLLSSSSLQSFLVPYLESSTGKLKLGARDLIVMMELTDSVTTNAAFDVQDLVLLVTFYDRVVVNGATTSCTGTTTTTTTTTGGGTTTTTTTSGHSNNGHGNNVDGVDSSNPGNAPFTDTNPLIDDERGRRNQ